VVSEGVRLHAKDVKTSTIVTNINIRFLRLFLGFIINCSLIV
jgi:hypothetical protein